MTATNKMELTAEAAAKLETAQQNATADLMKPDEPVTNVVGVGSGVKWKDGEATGEPAVLILVSNKVGKEDLAKEDLVPTKVGDVKTDVLEIGFPIAQQFRAPTTPLRPGEMVWRAQAPMPSIEQNGAPAPILEEEEYTAFTDALLLTRRIRPAEGGYSVGHYRITAGTLGTCVYDILPGGTTGSPPGHGVGIPPRYYILSNNHVLADVNAAHIGDPILQPGPFDGGTDPADRIATLTRFVPITLEPPTPRALHRNRVDAAIAQGQFHDLDREIYWIGYARGWRRKANIPVGTVVQKTGRTTNYTTGRITAINATVDVGYGGGRVGRFFDQIITTNISAGGDSGSLVLSLDNVALGLLFAGSSVATIVNQIENVRSLLRVEVAQQIL
ncbi:MAG TPA: hypothetical protein VFO03_09205 [Gaiellaceae bacterium]|nr:hypothetical protein [Gaiellaceae bacterium]